MALRLPAIPLPAELIDQLRALAAREGAPAFMYARISLDRNGGGLGIDRQLAEQASLYARHGLRLVSVYADNDISAYSGKVRPDYRAMLGAIDSGGASAVTCWHTDRLHRSVRELLDYIVLSEHRKLLTYGWRAGELDLSTPTGRAVAITQTAWARQESEHKSDRLVAQRRQAAQAGHWHGGPRPFGFEADGETIRTDEAAEIARATEAILAGASLRSTMIDLISHGFSTTRDKEWNPQAWRDTLLRPRNAGLAKYRGEVIGKTAWPAIVEEDTWRALVSVLTSPGRRTSPGNSVRWLGSGIYLCGICELPTMRVGHTGMNRKPAYRCSAQIDGKITAHLARSAIRVDELVEEALVAYLSRPDAIELLRHRESPIDVAALHAEATAKRHQLDMLDDDLDNERITRDRWLRRNESLGRRLDEIDQELTAAGMMDPLAGLVGAPNLRELWFGTRADRSDGLNLGRRRSVLASVMSVTILTVSKRGRYPDGSYFDRASVQITQKR